MAHFTKKFLVFLWLALPLFPGATAADTIDPASFTAPLKAGQSITVKKTAIVSQGTPTTAKVDIFFITDSTISMTVFIEDLQKNLDAIVSNLSGLGDVALAAGEYRDVGQAFVYRLNQDVTKDTNLVKQAIKSWVGDGMGDIPEANYYGLQQMAANSSWRAHSARIALWFGDAPSHDPAGPAPGVTQAQVIEALKAKSIRVEGINYGHDNTGINYDGQAQAIIDAVGGNLFSEVDSAQIAAAIDTAMEAAFANYKTVSLGTEAAPPGLTVTVSPPSFTGAYDRSTERTFEFMVTFAAAKPGVYNFDLPLLVDGGITAVEHDSVSVAAGIEPIWQLLLD